MNLASSTNSMPALANAPINTAPSLVMPYNAGEPTTRRPFKPSTLPVSPKRIAALIKIMQGNNLEFHVDQKRDRISLHYNNKCIIRTPHKQLPPDNQYIKAKDTLSLIAVVANAINRHLRKVNFDVEEIQQEHKQNYINRKAYNTMKISEVFYYIDINHCFWRIAWLYGYISLNLYKNWCDKPGFKSHLSKALACIKAEEKRTYYFKNKKQWTFVSCKHLHARVYNNIRFTSYNLMGELSTLLGEHCIGYKTDGIMVDRKHVPAVRDYLESHNFLFKVKKCRKADDRHYYDEYDGRLRKL